MAEDPGTAPALDAGAAAMLDILAKARAKGVPALHEVSPETARAMNQRSKDLFGGDGPEMATRELHIPGPAGPMRARLYRPTPSARAVVLYYHGGGWVIGSIDSHDGLCRELAHRSGSAVLSLDYRLAPEAPFPGAVDDAFAAFLWLSENAGSLGLDAGRIAVAGDSAGGNLAAVVALMARDRGGPAPSAQLLLYPATDMHLVTESHRTFRDHLLTPEAIEWFQVHYLKGAADRDDWRASPLRAPSLEGAAPAYVMTAGFDPLRDEGQAYASALDAAGTPLRQRRFSGQIHGFLTLDKVIPQALEAIEDVAGYIRVALAD